MRVSRVLVSVLASWSLAAHAQGRDPAAAEVLFRDAREAARRGDYAAACPKFAESQRLDPASGTLFNLADCEERTGKLTSAWQHWRQVAEELPAADERAGVAKEHASALERRLPKLTIRLAPGSPDGTKVTRDGVELGSPSLGVALPVDPGAHVVVVRAPGRREQRLELDLKEGQSETLALTVGESEAQPRPAKPAPAPVPAARTEAPPPSTGGNWRSIGYVVGGVGAASLVVGAVTGAMAMGKKSTFDSECDANKYCTQAGLDAESSGRSLATVSTVTFGLGLVGVGLGAYLVLREDGPQGGTALGVLPVHGGGAFRMARSF